MHLRVEDKALLRKKLGNLFPDTTSSSLLRKAEDSIGSPITLDLGRHRGRRKGGDGGEEHARPARILHKTKRQAAVFIHRYGKLLFPFRGKTFNAHCIKRRTYYIPYPLTITIQSSSGHVFLYSQVPRRPGTALQPKGLVLSVIMICFGPETPHTHTTRNIF